MTLFKTISFAVLLSCSQISLGQYNTQLSTECFKFTNEIGLSNLKHQTEKVVYKIGNNAYFRLYLTCYRGFLYVEKCSKRK
jgi:hypothetical protein